eukprot:TRINITY_DN15885_c0_g1_i5.p1 TRINITY_DN15885_c0_g1~~TRINITY_DN15885_c0_g1_i5.p1  ORF type:complete len:232 (-),score=33.94 TRINITY_DN15885_c0_g1_i5:481-1176(-)
MVAAAVRHAGGTLIRKKSPKMFNEWWLDTENSKAPYVLILHWRETKPCFDFLEMELSRGHIQKMPQAIYVVSQAGKAFRHALSWASSCKHNLKPTVSPEMTRDSLKAWLAGCMKKGFGVSQRESKSLAGYDATGHNQEFLPRHDQLQTTDCCKLQRNSFTAYHEYTPSQMVPVSSKQHEGLPVNSHTSSAKVQFSLGTVVVEDLVKSLQNPCMASWLASLLVESMPENYTD